MRFPNIATLCAVLLIVMAIACGPTAAPASDPTKTPPPATTPDPDDSENKPTPIPPPADKPAKTPRPTATRAPGDPPPQKPEPTEPVSMPPTPTPRPRPIPHPDGLAGCHGYNMFAVARDERSHLSWCMDTVFADIHENCRFGDKESERELACAEERLRGVVDITIGGFAARCAGVTNSHARGRCMKARTEAIGAHLRALTAAWNHIVPIVDDNGNVKNHYNKMVSCVEAQGYVPPDPNRPLSWQQIDENKIDLKAIRSADPEVRRERLRVTNQCALDVGLYDAQDAAWLDAIHDLVETDPEGAAALKDAGVIAALEEPGPAPFLTVRPLGE